MSVFLVIPQGQTDPVAEKIVHTEIVAKAWYGLRFSNDEKYLYASGGNDNWILKYAIVNRTLKIADSIKLGAKWPEKISPAGFDMDDAAKLMYVVTKENNGMPFRYHKRRRTHRSTSKSY